MKKTSQIVLTIVSGLSLHLGTAQNVPRPQTYAFPPDTNHIAQDSLIPRPTPEVEYTHYFRFRFFDNCYRRWFPHHYFVLTHPNHKPNPKNLHYGPRHDGATNHRVANTHSGSSPRGGFGHFGSFHSATA